MKEKNTPKMTIRNPIQQILDENNDENVILYDDNQKPIEFEQIAVIPLDDSDLLYAILIPVTPMQNVGEGEGVLFAIDELKGTIEVVNDQEIIDKVLTIYEKLVADSNKPKDDKPKDGKK